MTTAAYVVMGYLAGWVIGFITCAICVLHVVNKHTKTAEIPRTKVQDLYPPRDS